MPTSGTFVATFTQIGASGFNFTTPIGGFPAHSLAGVAGGASATYSLIGACFTLDGVGPAVDINGLPPGFMITGGGATTIRKQGASVGSIFGPSLVTRSNVLDSISTTLTFAGSTAFSGVYTVVAPADANSHPLQPVSSLGGSYLALDVNGIVTITITATVGGTGVGLSGSVFDLIQISGAYTAFQFAWDMPQDGDSVSPGDIITITSDFSTSPSDSMNLSQVTLSLPCGVIVPITQTTDLFTFLVPESCDGALTQTLTATGNGVQFSGSVPLGTLIILLVNASGIYTLVTGQRHDEYYSNLRDGTTVDIKIPNPTARTGFIGG